MEEQIQQKQYVPTELGELGVGDWSDPDGGYFVSFNTLPGLAKKVVGMMKDAGVVMTGAGATFPYGIDPEDKNIRIAPSYATPSDLDSAINLFTVCVRLASAEKLLEEKK